MNILLVGGNEMNRSHIKRALEDAHFTVTSVEGGNEAISLTEVNEYDMIIIDLLLPDANGVNLCRELRCRDVQAPIIILTSRNTISIRVSALDSGADDFLLKPADEQELCARIRALLRRERHTRRDNILTVNDLQLDGERYTVKRNGHEIPLTSKEYKLLNYLMRRPNMLCTKSMLEEHVWGCFHLRNSNVVEVTVSRLRKKLHMPGSTNLIETRRGVGYVMRAD